MQISTNITLNLKRPNINTVVHAKQNDRLTRNIVAQLMDGDQPWTPPQSGILSAVRFTKPDGHSGFYQLDDADNEAVTYSGNVATIALAEQALTCAGLVAMELNIYTSAGEKLTSFAFVIDVEESAIISDEEIESTDYFNVLTAQITSVIGRLDSVAGITAEAESIPHGEETYVEVTGGTGADDPYHLSFHLESGADGKDLNPRGIYSASEIYYKLDFVYFDGESYVAIRTVTGVTPGTSDEDWQPMSSFVSPSSSATTYAEQAPGDYTGNPPLSGWQSTAPVRRAGYYVWSKTITTYSDGTQLAAYSVAHNGLDGAGSVSSVDNVSPSANGNVALGAYKKPNTGIPKSDLAEDVKASLGKADTALQNHQSLGGLVEKNKQLTKTAAMTQRVGIDGDGVLYVPPGGGGGAQLSSEMTNPIHISAQQYVANTTFTFTPPTGYVIGAISYCYYEPASASSGIATIGANFSGNTVSAVACDAFGGGVSGNIKCRVLFIPSA